MNVPIWFRTQWSACVLKVIWAGLDRIAVTRHKHPHDHWTYCFVQQGSLTIAAARRSLTVSAGHAVVIPPYRRTKMGPARGGGPVVAATAGFFVEALPGYRNPLTQLDLPAQVSVGDLAGTGGSCARLMDCFSDWLTPASALALLRSRALLDLLLLDYLNQGFATGAICVVNQGPVPEWVQAFADLIAARAHDTELSPCNLFRLAGFSRAYVNLKFKQYLGITPRQYLRRQRVDLAMAKLADDAELSLADVAHTCGYSSQSCFNREFRRATGQTPGEFRRFHPQRGSRSGSK